MKRSTDMLPVHELIDLGVYVSSSTDPTIHGVRGRVIDETMNTFRIE